MDAQKIEQTAADWFAQSTSDLWSTDDQARLNAWMNESLAHRIAFIRAESVWNEVGRLQAIRAGVAWGTVPPRGESVRWVPPTNPLSNLSSSPAVPLAKAESRAQRRLVSPVTTLAASTLAAVIGLWFYSSDILSQGRYTTPIGRIDTVALADGSNVILNTDSRIRVDLTPKERRIELDRGEAFFRVANDPKRPFIVDIGDRRVVAVGTQFSVRRTQSDIRVTVTEGAVRLDHVNGVQSSVDLLRAGSVAHIRDHTVAVEQRPLPQTEEILSWRQGYLVFRDSALAEAVAEFNRYNIRKMVIADPSIADLKIGGHFRATSTDVFLWMLQNGFPVTVEEGDQEVVLKGR